MQAREKWWHRVPEPVIEEGEDREAHPADHHDVGTRRQLGVIVPNAHVEAQQQAGEAIDKGRNEECSSESAHGCLPDCEKGSNIAVP
jgi:hypothetical protein